MRVLAQDDGLSYVEVLAAAALIGLALVPLAQLYPVVLPGAAGARTGLVLGAAAVSKTEEILARLRDDIASVPSGSGPCPGTAQSQCLLTWTVAVEASSTSPGVGSLVRIEVTACLDGNGDGACGASEPQASYATKVTSRP
jgi:hypothetical protein